MTSGIDAAVQPPEPRRPRPRFGAKQVWLYATILAVGHMISRGMAKSGSREPCWDHDDGGHHDGPLTVSSPTLAGTAQHG